MKKILILLFTVFQYTLFAQTEIIGSNEFGRLIYLNYDLNIPDRIYAATGGNHIVVSEDAGENWQILYSFPSADYKGFQNLKIHNANELSFSVMDGYTNANKIYILNTATGLITNEYEVPIPADATSGVVYKYDFYDSNTLIAIYNYEIGGAGLHSRVYYTQNGNDGWNMIYYNFDFNTIYPNNVAISPANPQKIYICRTGGYNPEDVGGLYISEDGGLSYTEKLPEIDFGPITFHPDNPDDILLGTWYASNTQNLYRSTDGGDTWNPVDENWGSNVISNGLFDIKYNPTDANNIIVLGTNNIIRTDDNFETLEVIEFPNEMENPDNYYFGTYLSFNPFEAGRLLITNNDYALISDNGGATVTKFNNPFFSSISGQLNLYKSNNAKHLYYPVQNGHMHKNMLSLAENSYGTLPIQVLPFTTSKYYSDDYTEARLYKFSSYSGGSGLGISNNHGASYDDAISFTFMFLDAVSSKPGNQNIILCSLSQDNQNSSLIEFNLSDPAAIDQLIINLPEQGVVRDFHFDIANPGMMWIALNGKVYNTINNGLSWILQSTGLETLATSGKIYQISQNPLNTQQLTIATSQGVFTSVNAGANWVQLTVNEVQSVKHSDVVNGQMVAVTYDTQFTSFAVRYSGDSGNTWNLIPVQDLFYINSDTNSVAMEFGINTATLYIGTFDLGILKHTINFSQLSNNEPVVNNNYKLYPNPVADILTIDTAKAVVQLSVHDITGKEIIINRHYGNSLNVSGLAKGVYMLTAVLEDGQKVVSKFIKK